MDVFTPNKSKSDQITIFDELSREIRIITKKDGTILYKNKAANDLMPDASHFFKTLHFSEWAHTMSFFREMEDSDDLCEGPFVHDIDGEAYTIFYRGMHKNDHYYLSGQHTHTHTQTQKSALDGLLKHLPCGYVKVNHKLKIIEKNRSFINFVFPKVSEGSGIIDFERLRLETWPGVCMYQTVMESFRLQSFSERLDEDQEGERLFRSLAVYHPAKEEVIGLLFDESIDLKYEHLLKYKQQMESVSHLAAGVAHELRNPLSVIRGFLQLSELTDSFQKYAKTIFGEVDRMNKIIENFLSISRKNFDVHVISPMEVINTVEDIIRSECLLNNVHFEANIAKTDRRIKMNETMIKQVILNLLRNSMEAYAADAYKVFSLTTREMQDRYEITVKDNGQGIPKAIMEKLGDPFNTSKEKGTGIGISLSKKIIEDHHGTFRVESEENKGTTTMITLPFED